MQPIKVSKEENVFASSCPLKDAMSPGVRETPRPFSSRIKAAFAGSELWIVIARSNTVIEIALGMGCERFEDGDAHSPALRTRMGMREEVMMMDGKGGREARWVQFRSRNQTKSIIDSYQLRHADRDFSFGHSYHYISALEMWS